MNCKKTVAIFSASLQQANPRGAARLFRALVEHLIIYDNQFEFICLDQMMKGQNDTIYEFTPLRKWLNDYPLMEFFKPESPTRWQKIKSSINAIRNRMPGWLQLVLTIGLHFVRILKKIFRKITAKQLLNPEIKMGGDVIFGRDIDVLLNFWWLHMGETPIRMFQPNPRTKVVSWFLDGIPARLPRWQEGITDVDIFKQEVNTNLCYADHVVAISKCAAADANQFFGVEPKDISVIPCGIYKFDLQGAVVQKPSNEPAFLCVGIREPSKNVLNILRAALHLSNKLKDRTFQMNLVGAGPDKAYFNNYDSLLKRLQKRVRLNFLGYVSQDCLDDLMLKSEALIYPSLWEGFGIPPLEAMARGLPVIVSDIGPMPEVCGDLAYYCDPYDPISISAAMEKVLNMSDKDKATYQIEAKQYASGWSWESAAEKTVKMIEKIAAT